MPISDSTLLHDATLTLRNDLLNNITDPVTRISDSKFVMTSFPERDVQYPLILVRVMRMGDESLGQNSTNSKITVIFQIDIISQSIKQRDQLADSVYNRLRSQQLSSTYQGVGLNDFKLLNMTNIDNPGKAGIHRKIIECSYFYYTAG